MQIDPADVSPSSLYYTLISTILPRPIAWVGTRSAAGVRNLAPYSFFTGLSANPPTLCFCAANKPHGRPKDSARNAIETGEFVVNVVPFALAEAMVATSGEYPDDADEFALVGLESVPGVRVAAPRVVGAPVSYECTVHQVVPLAADDGRITAHLIIGRIRHVHVDDAVLGDDGRVDPRKLDAIGRMGGAAYCRTTDLFEVARPVV